MWTFHTCDASAILFGQVGLFFRWDLWLAITVLIGLMVLGSFAITRIRRWRAELNEDDNEPTEAFTLEHYQDLMDEGLLDPQEFERIKARMEMIKGDPNPRNDDATPSKDQPPDTSFREE